MIECPDCRDCLNLIFKYERTRIACKKDHFITYDGSELKLIKTKYKEQCGVDVEQREIFLLAKNCPNFDDMDEL